MRPAVSIIIPVYNGSAYLAETIESALAQRYSNKEILVVDDGSTDASAEIARSFGGRLRLVSQANSGVGAARNHGVRESRGRYLNFLDADDLLAPGFVEKLVETAEASAAGAVYSDWRPFRRGREGRFEAAAPVSRELAAYEDAASAFLSDFWAPPAAWLYSRDVFEAAGGFGPLVNLADVKFHIDAALAGARHAHAAFDGVLYREHPGGLSKTRQSVFCAELYSIASAAEARWTLEAGLTPVRRIALLGAYGTAARGSFDHDRVTFAAASAAMKKLDPGYVPTNSPAMKLLARAAGYPAAEAAASALRRFKNGFFR